MTVRIARTLLGVQADCGGSYNPDSAKRIPPEVDALISELERIFGFKPGTRHTGGLAPESGRNQTI